MCSAWRKKMDKLVDKMDGDASLSASQRKHVARLGQLNWAGDLAALAGLWRTHPAWVETYLDLLVCELHEFPESHLRHGRSRAPAAARARAALR